MSDHCLSDVKSRSIKQVIPSIFVQIILGVETQTGIRVYTTSPLVP